MTVFTQGRRRRLTLLEDMPASTSSVVDAYTSDPTLSPITQLERWGQRNIAQEGQYVVQDDVDEFGGFGQEPLYVAPKTPVLSVEDQQAMIKDAGVPIEPKEGMRQEVLEMLIEAKREEIARQSITSRATGWQSAAGFVSAVGASATDPLNLALAFVPVVGPAKYAAMLERAGSPLARAGVRAGVGAAEGTVGAALIEPLTYSLARDEQADYTLMDSFMNITMGTALGGGLHVGLGAVSDALSRGSSTPTPETDAGRVLDALSPNQRSEIMRLQVAAALDDRVVTPNLQDVTTVLSSRPNQTASALGTVMEAGARARDFRVEVSLRDNVQAADVLKAVETQNKPLFDELSSVSKEITDLTGQNARVREQLDVASKAVDRLEDLTSQLKTADKRKAPRLERNIEKTKAELRDLWLPDDLPKAKAKIRSLEKKPPQIAQKVKDLESREFKLKKKTDRLIQHALSRPVDPDTALRRIQDIYTVKNLRGYNGDQIKRVDEIVTTEVNRKFETPQQASDALQEEMDALKDAADALGDDADVAIPDELLREAEEIETYSQAISALAVCGLRGG